ncbi:MAG: recombinase RecB [Rickettsiales bacterium]|nr:MAG: recombinase RecB [Rickettsiales bacterium]
MISTVELASRASEIFKGSTTSEKRKLVNLVLSNLELKGQKLTYTLHSPFDQFVKTAKTGEWCTREESNP